MDADELYNLLIDAGTPAWVADAFVEAACNDGLEFLKTQTEKHTSWKRP